VVDGQIANQMEGPQDERSLRELIDSLTMSGGDVLKAQLEQYLLAQDWDGAISVLKQALADEPNNAEFKVEWADVLVFKGELDEARKVLATIAEDTPERDRPETRLALFEESASIDAHDALSRVDADEHDLGARYELAVTHAVAGLYQDALEQCMAILRSDRGFRDDIGRTTMIRIMALMGKNSDVSQKYRRLMFAFMH
jgi:putative thioredoxin